LNSCARAQDAGRVAHRLAALVTVSMCSFITLDSWRSSTASSRGVAHAAALHFAELLARTSGDATVAAGLAGVMYMD
jgi:hypothetical protein